MVSFSQRRSGGGQQLWCSTRSTVSRVFDTVKDFGRSLGYGLCRPAARLQPDAAQGLWGCGWLLPSGLSLSVERGCASSELAERVRLGRPQL